MTRSEYDSRSATATLLLVDGHAQAYRAFHAISSLTSPEGKPTNAIFGFIKMFEKLCGWLQPTHRAVVWDGGLAAERLALQPAYKAQRPPMPEALAAQLDEIGAWLDAAGIASWCESGLEADDGIAALARQSQPWAGRVVIASADKDFMQLVDERVGLVNPNDKPPAVWTDSEVEKRTGVKPNQIVDWLSLIGDTVDNIPGVAGVGPKTAAKLLNQFGSVLNLYGRLAEVGGEGLRERLREAEGLVRQNQLMIRLKDALLLPGTGEDRCRVKPPDAARLRELYRRWGFESLARALGPPVDANAPRQTDFLL